MITSFDDYMLQQYGICNFDDYAEFLLKYFKSFTFYNNPINCNCETQHQLINDTKNLILNFSKYKFIYYGNAYCAKPAAYSGLFVLNFDNKCNGSRRYDYCSNTNVVPPKLSGSTNQTSNVKDN